MQRKASLSCLKSKSVDMNFRFSGLLAACVRAEGKVLVYGAMGGIASTNISIRDTMFRGVSVTGFWLSRYMSSLSKERQRQVVTEVLELLEKGVLKPRTGRTFTLPHYIFNAETHTSQYDCLLLVYTHHPCSELVY